MKKAFKRFEAIVLSCAMAATMMPNLPNGVNTVHAESGIETGEQTVGAQSVKRTIALEAGANMTCPVGNNTQIVDQDDTLEQIVFKASERYYFSEKYIDDLNAVSGFCAAGLVASASIDRTELYISSGPLASEYSATLPGAEVAVPTGLGNGHTSITGTTDKMEYAPKKVDAEAADTEHINPCDAGNTTVSPGTYYVRYKAVPDNAGTTSVDETVPASAWVKVIVTSDAPVVTYSVSITANSGSVTGAGYMNEADGAGSNINISFTAKDGYGFTSAYVGELNSGTLSGTGITASLDAGDTLNKTLKITGTNVTKAVTLVIGASSKSSQEAPEVTSGAATITGFNSSTMEYVKTTEAEEIAPVQGAIWSSTMGALTVGKYWVRLKETSTLAAGAPIKITLSSSVKIAAGTNMSLQSAEETGNQIVNGAITEIVFKASPGYYFPKSYTSSTNIAAMLGTNSSVSAQVSADQTELHITGTPTEVIDITLDEITTTIPNAPSTVESGGINTITGIDSDMEYISTATFTGESSDVWTEGQSGKKLPAGTYYVRLKAAAGVAAGEKTGSITVNQGEYNVTITSGSDVFSYSNDYKMGMSTSAAITSTVFFSAPGYLLNQTNIDACKVNGLSAEVTLDEDGKTYLLTVSGTPYDTTVINIGDATEKAAGPASPSNIKGGCEVITGVDDTMEYGIGGSDLFPIVWTRCTASPMTVLTPSPYYYVRVAETATTQSSSPIALPVVVTAKKKLGVDNFNYTDLQPTYDGLAKTATVTGKALSTSTAITVKYTDNEGGEVETPTSAGTYNVLISRAADATYAKVTDLKVGELTIKQKEITLTGTVTAKPKTYDGTRAAEIASDNLALTPSDIYSSDVVSLDKRGAILTFASANAANSVNITASGYALSGAAKDNYKITQPKVAAVKIDKAKLTVSVEDIEINAGEELPELSVNVTGFVNGESAELEGFVAPTAVVDGEVDTTDVTLETINVSVTGGTATANYEFDTLPTTANIRIIKTVFSVTITPGAHMTATGKVSQADVDGAMEDVTFVADAGYYFPADYSVATVNGVNVTRVNNTTIKVSGTPIADTEITLTAPTAKTAQAAPTGLGDGRDRITGTTAAMEYATRQNATKWTACTKNSTAVAAGTYYVRYAETDTKLAGAAAKVVVTAFKKPAEFILNAKGIYVMDNTNNVITAGLVTNKADADADIEYRWEVTKDSGTNWTEISDWKLNNEWIYWSPEGYGDYILVCKARLAGDASTEVATSLAVASHPILKGICQIPWENGTFLIGMETYDNDDYSYEMQVLDCSLLETETPWIYTTGKLKTEGNAAWTTWAPVVGYYWTLFRVYDKNGNIIDEACYGFTNAQ